MRTLSSFLPGSLRGGYSKSDLSISHGSFIHDGVLLKKFLRLCFHLIITYLTNYYLNLCMLYLNSSNPFNLFTLRSLIPHTLHICSSPASTITFDTLISFGAPN